MIGGVKMLGRMTSGRLVTTSDVATGPAQAEVQPYAARFEAFLTTQSARGHNLDRRQMCASCHCLRLTFCSCRTAACHCPVANVPQIWSWNIPGAVRGQARRIDDRAVR